MLQFLVKTLENYFPEFSFLILAVVISLCITRSQSKKKGRFPPGPRGIPVFGYIPFLGRKPFETLHNLSKKYGCVFSVKFGSEDVLVLASFSAIKEAFKSQYFLGRPNNGLFRFSSKDTGYVDDSWDEWKEQRTFTRKVLQSLGFGKSSGDDIIKKEAAKVVEQICNCRGQPLFLDKYLLPSLLSCVSLYLHGRMMNDQDATFCSLQSSTAIILHYAKQSDMFQRFPFGKFLSSMSSMHTQAVNEQSILYQHLRNEITEIEKNMDFEDPKSFIEHYLVEIAKNQKSTNFTKDKLVGNVWMNYAGGYDSVGGTMNWCTLIMAKFGHIQTLVQKEIDEVVGELGSPTWDDNYALPFTLAAFSECQRWKTVVSDDLLRSTSNDIVFRGFDIPKGTKVLALLHSAHYDRDYWTEPEQFRPERFLSEDRKTFVKREAYIPFSFGKRNCPGQVFATRFTFTLFASLMQKFRILPASENDEICLDGIAHITYNPKSQKLIFRQRN